MPVDRSFEPIAATARSVMLGGELEVNRLGFGALWFSGPGAYGELADPIACRRVLQRAVELGVTFVDTGASYGDGASERVIRDALATMAHGVVVATKGG